LLQFYLGAQELSAIYNVPLSKQCLNKPLENSLLLSSASESAFSVILDFVLICSICPKNVLQYTSIRALKIHMHTHLYILIHMYMIYVCMFYYQTYPNTHYHSSKTLPSKKHESIQQRLARPRPVSPRMAEGGDW